MYLLKLPVKTKIRMHRTCSLIPALHYHLVRRPFSASLDSTILGCHLQIENKPCLACLTLSQTVIFRLFQNEEFADDNFEFDENSEKFSKSLENTGKRRNCLLRSISPFSTVFSKDLHCRHVKTRACLEMG